MITTKWDEIKFWLSDNGIFKTFQGEGSMLGVPMVFVRLAGCSVGCVGCDTNYRAKEQKSIHEIMRSVCELMDGVEWIWITGGEPADNVHLRELVCGLELLGSVALATSGIKTINANPDYISVSPHFKPSFLKIKKGNQINMVFGMNDLQVADWYSFDFSGFEHKWVTPFDKNENAVSQCMEWISSRKRENWKLGVQAHKSWRIA
jgi:organic radical activating enzyme